ncbi:ribosomal L1 domain-containing protein 1 [Eudromia elegans]
MAGTAVAGTAEGLERAQVRRAAQALLALSRSGAGRLLGEGESVFLVLTVWKIPRAARLITLPLPHGVRGDAAEVCLFTRDEPHASAERTERAYRELLARSGVSGVTRIISYKTLKSEYKPFEAKRRLMNAFDLFLSDARIRRLLPSHLGKHFYRSKKVPLSVNLQASNLAKELNKYIQGSVLPVTNKGCCYTARIGHTGMKANEIVENVMAAAEVIAKKLPKNWKNVKILHLKTAKSIALPIFTAQISKLDELDREPLVDKREEKKEKKKGTKKTKKASEKMTLSEVAEATESNAAAAKQEPAMKEKAELGQEPDDDDGEIPQLVPIDRATSVAQLKKMEPNENPGKGGKPSKKTKTRLGKRKNPFPQETPRPKHKVTAEQASLPVTKSPKQKQAKQLNTPKEAIKKKELKKTPRKPEAKFFATPKAGKLVRSAKKSAKRPK